MIHARKGSVLLFFCLASASAAAKTTAKEVIESFYKGYLNGAKTPTLAFSKSFNELVTKNDAVCKAKAGSDVCGWGADGDIFFDAQEYKPESYEKAGLRVKESTVGKVV